MVHGCESNINFGKQSHELFFYRGNVLDMQGYPMKEKNFNFIVDLIDLYIDLVEELTESQNNISAE